MPSLSALRAFEVVGRTKSFRKAAEELHVTHTAISQHMRDLEAWFGTALVLTTPRGTQPTVEGQRLHAHVSAAFSILEQGIEELRPRSGSSKLTLWCAPGFAAHWITPRYKSLEQHLPDVEIVLRPSDTPANLIRHEADIEISYGARSDPLLTSELLIRPAMLAVASPAWLGIHPTARDPQMLARMPLIHEKNHEEWQQWFAAIGMLDIPELTGPRFWIATAGLEAARLGYGVALLPEPIAAADLAAGSLVRVVEASIELEAYYLVVAKGRSNEMIITRFRRWITSTLAIEGSEEAMHG